MRGATCESQDMAPTDEEVRAMKWTILGAVASVFYAAPQLAIVLIVSAFVVGALLSAAR